MAKKAGTLDCSSIISEEMSKALIRRLKVQVNEKLKQENADIKRKLAKANLELRRYRRERKDIQDINRVRENVLLACKRMARIIKAVEQLKNRKVGSVVNSGDPFYETVRREGRAINAVKRLARKNS